MRRVPTLLVASAGDRLLPSLTESARLQRLIPGAQRLVLPDSGHTALLEVGGAQHTPVRSCPASLLAEAQPRRAVCYLQFSTPPTDRPSHTHAHAGQHQPGRAAGRVPRRRPRTLRQQPLFRGQPLSARAPELPPALAGAPASPDQPGCDSCTACRARAQRRSRQLHQHEQQQQLRQ